MNNGSSWPNYGPRGGGISLNRNRFWQALTGAALAAAVRYQSAAGRIYEQPLWRIILHPVNHGTHRRSEIGDMLSRSGAREPGLELIQFERLSEAERRSPIL